MKIRVDFFALSAAETGSCSADENGVAVAVEKSHPAVHKLLYVSGIKL